MKKACLLLLAFLLCSRRSQGQIPITAATLSYEQHFDSLDYSGNASALLPAGWQLLETGSSSAADQMYKANTGSSSTGDTYSYGMAGDTDRALGMLGSNSIATAIGARFVNNTGVDISSIEISFRGEQWRFGYSNRNGNPDSLRCFYSLNAAALSDASASWTELPSMMFHSMIVSGAAPAALNGNIQSSLVTGTLTLPVPLPAGGAIMIRWVDENIAGSDDGLAIDDLVLSFHTLVPPPGDPHPVIVATDPAANSYNIDTGALLKLVFSKPVVKGTGFIRLVNETDHTQQQIDVTSMDVTVGSNGDTVSIGSALLAPASKYHVLVDSLAFDTAGYYSQGIYDTAAWNFCTVGYTGPLAVLDESWDAACGPGQSLTVSGWIAYSLEGSRHWKCNASGYNSTPCAEMYGVDGVEQTNEDWLISPMLDLSQMPMAYLQFRGWTKYAGPYLEVFTSNNFNGDPATANWEPLNVNFNGVGAQWNIYEAELTPFIATPIHIGFRYLSQALPGQAAQWKIDDIKTSAAPVLAVPDQSVENKAIAVYGSASMGMIRISKGSLPSGLYDCSVVDLTGRLVLNRQIAAENGEAYITMPGVILNPGCYILHVRNRSCGFVSRLVMAE